MEWGGFGGVRIGELSAGEVVMVCAWNVEWMAVDEDGKPAMAPTSYTT